MKSATLAKRVADAEALLKQGDQILLNLVAASSTKTVDAPTQQFLGGYAVVAICGVYEELVEEVFRLRAAKAKDKELESFVITVMHEQFRNPDYAKIKKYLKCLDPGLPGRLDKRLTHLHTTGLDSIVTNKNEIAHGRPSSVTLSDVKGFHKRAVTVLAELEKLIL